MMPDSRERKVPSGARKTSAQALSAPTASTLAMAISRVCEPVRRAT
jgi:hypothetical protein